MKTRRTAARVALIAIVTAGLAATGAPAASAWYPNGFTTTYGACSDPAPRGELDIVRDLREPLEGHVTGWSAERTTFNSPSHRETERTQRRAATARVVDSGCTGNNIRWVEVRYATFEQRQQIMSRTKGGASERPVPGYPVTTDWKPL